MYGVQRRSWIAMGDPVGPPDVRRELAWQFRELADRTAGSPRSTRCGPTTCRSISISGSTLRKLGEEARVPLDRLLARGRRAQGTAQHAQPRSQREGCTLRGRAAASGAAAARRAARDLATHGSTSKHTREKRFSLGFFDPAYLARMPIAVVRREDRIVAFANIWAPDAARGAVDRPDAPLATEAPSGVMDYLFIELLVWGHDAGLSAGSASAWRRSRASSATASRRSGTGSARCCSATASTSTTSRACARSRTSSIRSGSRATSRRRAASRCRSC